MRLYKRGRVWWCWAYVDGERVRVSTQCRDKAAAEIAARRIERRASDPADAATRAETLDDAVQRLLTSPSKRATATTEYYAKKAGHLTRVLGASQRLATLTRHQVEAYLVQRAAEGAGPHTIQKELVVLRVVLRTSIRAGCWAGNVDAIIPSVRAEYKPRTRWLTVAELSGVLGQLLPDRSARVAFSVAVGATWSDTDRAQREDIQGDTVLVRGLKTSTRWRTIPMVLPEQKSLIRFCQEHAQGVGGDLFLPWANVRRDLHAACARAGIPPCSPNDLRRTLGHWLRGAGAPPDLIGLVLGHADSRMVERVYGRIPVEVLRARLLATTGALPAAQCDTIVPTPPDSAVPDGTVEPENVASIQGNLGRVTGIEPATRGVTVPPSAWSSPRPDASKQNPRGCTVTQLCQRKAGNT